MLPKYLIPSVILHSRAGIRTVRMKVTNRHTQKLKHLSIEQERPLFDVHDTVKQHNINIVPPRYVLDTLALGPRNAILDQFNSFDVLAELDILLNKGTHHKI